MFASELVISLAAIAAITAAYVGLAREGAPLPSSFWGHTLGIVGFLLMVCTETLYTLRKRVPGFNLGRMNTWLRAHIVTGLVGAYLVVLHTAWRFQGLAGVLTLLTVLIVLSGLVGRYIYTAVPRTLDGAAVAYTELQEKLAHTDRVLHKIGGEPLRKAATVAVAPPARPGWFLVLARPILRRRQQERCRRFIASLDEAHRPPVEQLRTVLAERQRLQMEVDSWDATRRLLALWHMFHIPLSGALFALAFIHIFASLYYATLMK